MTLEELRKISDESGISLHEAALIVNMSDNGDDPQKTKEELLSYLKVILEESEKQYGKVHNTLTGMTGDNAQKIAHKGPILNNTFVHTAIVTAMSISESNASMGRVVACPTAGASGIIPGVFYAMYRIKNISLEKLLEGYIISAAIGNIISSKATLSGAAGGCQAEIGSAVAMASAALTYIYGGDCSQIGSAAALSLKSLLGLVCDPIGGYVEVPCVKRNASLVSLAITCSEIALSGVESVVPFDEVVTSMERVGKSIPWTLRETGLGGIAITPTAKKIIKDIKEKNKKAL